MNLRSFLDFYIQMPRSSRLLIFNEFKYVLHSLCVEEDEQKNISCGKILY